MHLTFLSNTTKTSKNFLTSDVAGLEKYFLRIEEFLDHPASQPQHNKPFVIHAEEGVGKKTLLVKWMQYHEKNKKSVFFKLFSDIRT